MQNKLFFCAFHHIVSLFPDQKHTWSSTLLHSAVQMLFSFSTAKALRSLHPGLGSVIGETQNFTLHF